MEDVKAEALPSKTGVKEVEPKQAPSKEVSARVSKKIDMNTVELTFDGKISKGRLFDIISSGVLHGSGEATGEETQVVALDRYLPRNTVHDFSVVLK